MSTPTTEHYRRAKPHIRKPQPNNMPHAKRHILKPLLSRFFQVGFFILVSPFLISLYTCTNQIIVTYYVNRIANNQLMKLNWSIVIATSIIMRFSCFVVMWCIVFLLFDIITNDSEIFTDKTNSFILNSTKLKTIPISEKTYNRFRIPIAVTRNCLISVI